MTNTGGSACEFLIGKTFEGQKKPGQWAITEKVDRAPGGSGGTFSIGYLAIHDDGTEAFVKATDIGLLTRGRTSSALERTLMISQSAITKPLHLRDLEMFAQLQKY